MVKEVQAQETEKDGDGGSIEEPAPLVQLSATIQAEHVSRDSLFRHSVQQNVLQPGLRRRQNTHQRLRVQLRQLATYLARALGVQRQQATSVSISLLQISSVIEPERYQHP